MRVRWRRSVCLITSLFFTCAIFLLTSLFRSPDLFNDNRVNAVTKLNGANQTWTISHHVEYGKPNLTNEYPSNYLMVVRRPYSAPMTPSFPPPKSDEHSTGPGEGGGAYVVNRTSLSPDEQAEFDRGWTENAYNQFVSDRISIRRYLPDSREEECKKMRYDPYLPQTAVVICFHNEGWSALLRSVHSVIDYSPAHLLKEIVLVDDFSDRAYLKKPLEAYVSQLHKVRILRTTQREGLIRARMLGFHATTAEVVTFLDSHIECTPGWLEPLLDRIKINKTNVVVPIVEVINSDDLKLQISRAADVFVGGFDWSLEFDWFKPSEKDLRRPGAPFSPIRSPTMPGGLFSIHRKFFEQLGLYDPEMEVWGAENLELSFKTWMCGGTLEFVPCSHVGHIFRDRSPYSWTSRSDQPLQRNNVRLAEVWMDDFKKIYYETISFQLGEYGDVSDRKALRERLKCRSFRWYLDSLLPEMFIPTTAVASGEIFNEALNICADSKAKPNSIVSAYPCHGLRGNQLWYLSKSNEIRRNSLCWDAGIRPRMVGLYQCHGSGGNQLFEYTRDRCIKHEDQCLTLSPNRSALFLAPCSSDTLYQRWMFVQRSNSKN